MANTKNTGDGRQNVDLVSPYPVSCMYTANAVIPAVTTRIKACKIRDIKPQVFASDILVILPHTSISKLTTNMKFVTYATSIFFTLAFALPRNNAQTAMLEDVHAWHPPSVNDCVSSLPPVRSTYVADSVF